MSDPEETAPITPQPYGGEPGPPAGQEPYVSPSGPGAAAPPPPPTPPAAGGVPYGAPAPGPPYGQQPGYQQGWQPGWTPAYGSPYAGSLDHKGATTSLALGIIATASLLLTPFCCITIPGVLCAPFAWWTGAKAKREIQQQPGVYGNLGTAQTGMWMGVATTVLGAIGIAGLLVVVVLLGRFDLPPQ